MKFSEKVYFDAKRPYLIYPLLTDGREVMNIDEESQEVMLGECNEAPSQQFLFEEEGHAFRIRSALNGNPITVMKDDPSEGVALKCEEKGFAES